MGTLGIVLLREAFGIVFPKEIGKLSILDHDAKPFRTPSPRKKKQTSFRVTSIHDIGIYFYDSQGQKKIYQSDSSPHGKMDHFPPTL